MSNGNPASLASKMRVACATTSHDVEEGECPWCTIERLTRESEAWDKASLVAIIADRDRLTVERDQLLTAIGEHVTVRSDQYALIQRLTRERDSAREALRISEQRVREHWPERDRLLTALKSIRDLRCSAFRTYQQNTEDMRAIASRALALPSEPNSAPETSQ